MVSVTLISLINGTIIITTLYVKMTIHDKSTRRNSCYYNHYHSKYYCYSHYYSKYYLLFRLFKQTAKMVIMTKKLLSSLPLQLLKLNYDYQSKKSNYHYSPSITLKILVNYYHYSGVTTNIFLLSL